MSKRRRFPALAVVAVVIWVTGISWSARTWRELGDAQKRWGERRAQLGVIRGLAGEDAQSMAVQEQARRLASGTADGLSQLLEQRASTLRAADSRDKVEPLGDGWGWRVRELVFEDASIVAVMSLVDEAERLEPPWRLRGCEIRASAHTPGNGQVSVALGLLQPAP